MAHNISNQIQMNKTERGMMLVTLGVGMTAFLGFVALVTDLGNIYLAKAQLQNTADSSALASVVEIPKGTTAALQKAVAFGQSHYVAGQNIVIENDDVDFGRYNFTSGEFQVNVTPVNSVTVQARRTSDSSSGPLPLFFAPVVGRETSNVQAVARAALDPHVVGVQGKNRLIPYSVINFVVDQNNDGLFDIGNTINIYPRNDAPGNFGFLDLDGGSNDIPELREYLENGYDKDFVIPAGGSKSVFGSTGIEGNSVLDSFHTILNEVVFLPVHSFVINPGSNATFNIIGILAVKIKSVKLNGNINTRYIRVEIINFASSVLVTDPNAPANNSLAKPRLVT